YAPGVLLIDGGEHDRFVGFTHDQHPIVGPSLAVEVGAADARGVRITRARYRGHCPAREANQVRRGERPAAISVFVQSQPADLSSACLEHESIVGTATAVEVPAAGIDEDRRTN